MIWHKFRFKVRHDTGVMHFTVWAADLQSAMAQLTTAERCPASALVDHEVIGWRLMYLPLKPEVTCQQ